MENPHKALAGLVFDKDTVSASKMVPVSSTEDEVALFFFMAE